LLSTEGEDWRPQEIRMAVYKRGYQRYQGPIQGRWAKFCVLPRFAWRRMLSQRLVVLLLVLSMIWPLLCAVYLYIGNHADLLKGIGVSPDFLSFIRGDGSFFMVFMNVQAVFAVFLAALTGPGCIAPDLANNALPLYFSRPITRGEYALGRLVTLVGLLSIITWIPGMLLFIMQASMAGWSWFSENWGIGAGIFAGFAVWILLVSLVALTSSAYAKMKVIAGGIVLGFFFILSGASNIINVVFRSKSGFIINPSWATRRLWYAMLEVDPPEGPGVLFCLCALVVLFLLLALILERKLRPVEVIT
jgi:ABC-2 type transport system permease protein